MSEKDSSYRESLKSLDTEENIDLWFYRPIGYAWACLARKIGITPNAITIASIFLGIGAGVAFYFNNIRINIIGIVLLIWANSFDSADGQLARMTKQYSRIGRILDGLSGDIRFFTIYLSICLRENATAPFFHDHPWVIWVIAVTAGIFHAKQAATADYYRQFHLYFLKGEEGSELESSKLLRQKFDSMPWKGNFGPRSYSSSTPTTHRVGAPLSGHADLESRACQSIQRTHAKQQIQSRIPQRKPPSDEIHKHPIIQLALHSPIHISTHRHAVAILHIRTRRTQRDSDLHDILPRIALQAPHPPTPQPHPLLSTSVGLIATISPTTHKSKQAPHKSKATISVPIAKHQRSPPISPIRPISPISPTHQSKRAPASHLPQIKSNYFCLLR